MAITLVAFVGARLAMTYWLRRHLMPPEHISSALGSSSGLGFSPGPAGVTFVASPPSIPNAWVYSGRLVDQAGQQPTSKYLQDYLLSACPKIGTLPQRAQGGVLSRPVSHSDCQDCITKLSSKFHEAVTYQPATRYWAFQAYETAIFLVVALIRRLLFLVGPPPPRMTRT